MRISTLIPDSATRRALPPFIERLLSFGEHPDDSEDTRQLKRLIVGALWVSLGPNTVTTGFMFAAGAPLAGVALLAIGLVVFLILVALEVRPSLWPRVFHLLVAGNFAVSVYLTLLFGGISESGTNFIWGFAGVLAAVVIFRDKRAVAWLGAYVVLLITTALLATSVEARYELANPAVGTVGNLVIVGVFTFLVLLYFIKQRDSLSKQSDDLLRNVLPDEIADRLKRSGEMIADHFEDASILFADVVGFTPMSAEMAPAETVELLNDVFSAFDDMVDRSGLEKIKTIGDEYMVAGGVPHARKDHAHALADLALEMRSYVARNEIQGRTLTFRIGINSGPVVAGIIGTRKFTYDLWGDAVNTASRMESYGTPGKIQISQATHDLISTEFECHPQGEIDIKGKGRVPVWYLEGRS